MKTKQCVLIMFISVTAMAAKLPADGDGAHLSADFVMTRTLSALSQDIESKGKLYIGGPGKLRFEVTAPTRSILVLNKNNAFISYPDVGVTRKFDATGDPVMALLSKHLFALMQADEKEILKHYDLKEKKDEIKKLVPKDANIRQYFSEISVRAKNVREIKWVQLTSKNGDLTRIEFFNVDTKVKLANELFELQVSE